MVQGTAVGHYSIVKQKNGKISDFLFHYEMQKESLFYDDLCFLSLDCA